MSTNQGAYILIVGLLIFQTTSAVAQIEAINWCFGSNVGLSFTTSPPTTVPGYAIHTYEGCAVISDSVGDLLFYTDGVTVWNSLHQVMPNGTGLQGDNSSSQSANIIPAPGAPGIYYIVTAPEITSNNPMSYSIVDMGLNGGLGSVVLKNAVLLGSATATEKVNVARHQNGIDYWIVTHEYSNANFLSYLVTQGGINTNPVVSTVGGVLNDTIYKLGIIKISPCGTQLAITNHGTQNFIPSFVELFSFNNATGQVSNAMQLYFGLDDVYGLEFSPDNSKLYMAFINPAVIVQYDITSGNQATIVASADTIGQPSAITGAMQTGPDGKIYVSKYVSYSLGCITNPNLPGLSSGYVNNYVPLPDSCFLGLPSFVSTWFCEPNSVGSDLTDKSFSVSPNPFISELTITFSGQHPDNISINLSDINDNEVLISQKGERGNNQVRITADGISSGVYILTIANAKQISRRKIIKL